MERAPRELGPRLVRLNGELKMARVVNERSIEFSYQSAGRSIAVLDRGVKSVQIDGMDAAPVKAGPATVLLPRGQHVVSVEVE